MNNSTDGSECLVLERNTKDGFWHGTEVYSSKLTAVKQTLTANEIRLPVGGSFGREPEGRSAFLTFRSWHRPEIHPSLYATIQAALGALRSGQL